MNVDHARRLLMEQVRIAAARESLLDSARKTLQAVRGGPGPDGAAAVQTTGRLLRLAALLAADALRAHTGGVRREADENRRIRIFRPGEHPAPPWLDIRLRPLPEPR